MKKNIYILISVIAAALVCNLSCNKSIEGRTDSLPALSPSNIDINAGNWKMVLLSRPDSFAVATPAATNSPGYLGELNEIKGLQGNLTSDQTANIKYWNAGAVLRWNEIMRDLVTKYNLPPYQNEDGSYPIPNSANPFAYPQFPFSNPPYAARAYAYVSAAQYDALVACWYYKKLYNRPAPYKTDSIISANTTLIAKTNLPSYPSEDAVLAGVTAEMMKLFFPTEVAHIEELAANEKASTLASGKNTRSDWTAGETLGRQIAAVFAARGRTDNAGKAVGTPDQWKKLETGCIARGETPWISLETPKRPPMLPFFGNVKPFLFDSLTVIALRPGPPPQTASVEMKNQTNEVLDQTTHATRENYRIVHFWSDGAGTYTPPGHWNAIAADDFIKQNYSEVRWARNLALLNMAEMDAAIVCWNTKYFYFNPRPSQMNPAIKSLTGVPNFPSYISGHSTFSGAAVAILSHIIPANAEAYKAMAEEAARSRFIGGLHYNESDCAVGLVVGDNIGKYAVQRAKTDGAE
jgi:hypothetical protein